MAESLADPPAPVQVILYVVVAAGATEALPERVPPVEKLVPVQLLASFDDQASVDEAPGWIEVGFAFN